MIVVVAALKGGVGKTTTSVYLAALAGASRRTATLVDADPQASAADWLENSDDDALERISIVEAPTDRLLTKAIDRAEADDVVLVDTPPGNERLLAKAISIADVVVVPTRVGGVETPRVDALLDMVPNRVPTGLVMCSARTVTRDYHDTVDGWTEAGVEVWGTVPERVAIAAGPAGWLAGDGIEAYRNVWRRVQRAARRLTARRPGLVLVGRLVGCLLLGAFALGALVLVSMPAGAHGDTGTMAIDASSIGVSTPSGAPGEVDVEVRIVYTNDGEAAAGATASATATDAAGATTAPVTLVDAGDGTYAGSLAVPTHGSWTVRVESTNPAASAEQTIEVAAAPTTTTSTDATTGTRAESRASDSSEDTATEVIVAVAAVVVAAGLTVWLVARRRRSA